MLAREIPKDGRDDDFVLIDVLLNVVDEVIPRVENFIMKGEGQSEHFKARVVLLNIF